MGSPRAAAYVCIAAVRSWRVGRSNRAAGRSQPDRYDGIGLPASDRTRPYSGRRGDGPDLRLDCHDGGDGADRDRGHPEASLLTLTAADGKDARAGRGDIRICMLLRAFGLRMFIREPA